MQGLVVVGLIVEAILNGNVKCVKGTGGQNIGQVTGSRDLPSQYILEKHYVRFAGYRSYT